MNTVKKGLGKGLGALLSDVSTDVTGKNVVPLNAISEIPINEIEANPFQPREKFEEESLDQLVESIKIHGIIQPVTVRKVGYGKYQLISGERRTRAAIRAELKTIPAYVRIADDQGMLEMSLIENLHRDDLNPIEVALSYKRLIEECNLTQEDVANRISINRSTVTNFLRILKLPDEIQLALRDKILTVGHAKMIVGLEDETMQMKMFRHILDNNLSVRSVEEEVKKIKENIASPKKVRQKKILTTQLKEWEEKFAGLTQSKVRIKTKTNGKGELIIPFRNEDDLRKIAGMLGDEKTEKF